MRPDLLHRRSLLALGAWATGFSPIAQAEPKVVKLCANAALGAPDSEATPYLMLRRLQDELPFLRLQVTPLPWNRCLQEAAQGRFDGVLSASHTPERAQTLRYPATAAGTLDDSKRMFQLGYALVRLRGAAAHWDGTHFTGTTPKAGDALGAERGFAIAQFARERGAHVEERSLMGNLLEGLRLRRVQGILVNQEFAAQLLAQPEWAGQLELGGPALAVRPYFLPLNSAWATREPALAETLWTAVERVRRTPAFAQAYSHSLSAGQRGDLKP
ncbi:substrate-binding periplasmic protein [Inhella gelatinilytica]|uniref:Solute-binding protein family 3/N-terminal domain-containing protein n=1 Tax=Inhella gelatinilytica TaxID=2795030 RepID=A0A931ISC1_9BURK|nr:transporter substrate-binding domain-containing protein [Inhella gelatinilytica]MBH9551782.1 hypothetical protein [Inhella gelatinilytica]